MKLKNRLWQIVAYLVSHPKIADYLVNRAIKTPYYHLEGYMDRYWLFNRYSEIGKPDVIKKRFPFLPAIRVHHILRADLAKHPHDHPWNARTIILDGEYTEKRMTDYFVRNGVEETHYQYYYRRPGNTATLKFGEYHHITEVTDGGVWTIFITWKYMGGWGFWVNGRKIPHKEYIEAGGRVP